MISGNVTRWGQGRGRAVLAAAAAVAAVAGVAVAVALVALAASALRQLPAVARRAPPGGSQYRTACGVTLYLEIMYKTYYNSTHFHMSFQDNCEDNK